MLVAVPKLKSVLPYVSVLPCVMAKVSVSLLYVSVNVRFIIGRNLIFFVITLQHHPSEIDEIVKKSRIYSFVLFAVHDCVLVGAHTHTHTHKHRETEKMVENTINPLKIHVETSIELPEIKRISFFSGDAHSSI